MAEGQAFVLPTQDSWGKVQDAVAKINNVTGAASQTATGITLGQKRDASRNCLTPDWIVAKITGGDARYGYTWVEQIAADDLGGWQDMPGGRTSDMGKAFEFNGNTVSVNDIVEIIPTMQGTFAFPMDRLRWGVVITVGGPCDDVVVVDPSTRAGVSLGKPPHTVYLTNPLTMQGLGFAVKVDDIIAYHYIGTGEGLMVNPYKPIDVRYECDSVEPVVPDLESLQFNEFDFTIGQGSYNECPINSIAMIRWTGFTVCDSYSGNEVDKVKKICFDGSPVVTTGTTVPVTFTTVATDDTKAIEGCESNPVEFKRVSVSGSVVIPDSLYGLTVYDCESGETTGVTSLTFADGLQVSGTTVSVRTPNAGDNISIDAAETPCDTYTINWDGMTVGDCTGVKSIALGEGLDADCDEDEATLKVVPCDTDDPVAVGADDEDSENEDGMTWAIGDGPVNVTMCSRVGYFESGDKKLYGYNRTLTFDACGKLVAISAETRYEIDEPEDCGSESMGG